MILQDIMPVIVMLGIAFIAIAIAAVLKIRSKKSLLRNNDKDFIDEIIERKKRKLNANIGGMTWTTYVGLMVMCPISIGVLSAIFLSNKAFAIVFAFCGLFIPDFMIRMKAKKQKKEFDEKYAMALRAMASGLRSGLTIEQAVENVGRNAFMEPSIRNGFRQIASDIKLGIPLEEAFATFAIESNNDDAKDVAAVIAMQSKVGGSEAAVITTIVQNISNRIMMRNEIKALFADTDMLVLVMDIMPFLLVAILYFAAPDLIMPFFESTGRMLLLAGIMVFTMAGSLIIHKISSSAKGG